MQNLLGPILVSTAFVLAIIALCLVKPNAGRIFLGIFFLAMALGVNGYFTFGNPQSYLDYANGALIPFYRSLAVGIVSINPVLFGILLILFEISVAVLLLHKGQAVKIGLIGAMLFILGITPLSLVQIPWLGLVIAQGYLLTKTFERSVWQWLRSRLLPGRV